jgi:hypothetical protein
VAVLPLNFEFKIISLRVSKLPLNGCCGLKYLSTLTPANFKVAKERTEELFELFKELDEITGMVNARAKI